jgi:serine phosphatase RsbU (regulator of sigma subunit)
MLNGLLKLISHNNWVQANQNLGAVFQNFTNHDFDFMAVLEEGVVLGLCSRWDIGMSLGSQYGFSLFASKPIKGHVLPNPVFVTLDTPINAVFTAAFARSEDAFYEDVILLSPQGEFLGLIATQTLVKLQNRHHLDNIQLLEDRSREIRWKNEQIEEDLRLSRELQQALLPASYPVFSSRQPEGRERLRFCHYYRSVGLVGGDFFLIQKLDDTTAGVFIADVMGHGIRAALVTAMLRAMLDELAEEFRNPADLIAHVNRELCGILSQVEETALFVTAFYVLADTENRRLRYASAGHPLPIHIQQKQGRVLPLEHREPGTVLGVFEQAVFSNGEAIYEAGDSLVLYTDGISEMVNPAGEEFGLDRLCAGLAASYEFLAGEQKFASLISQAESFVGQGGFRDDICLVGIDLA